MLFDYATINIPITLPFPLTNRRTMIVICLFIVTISVFTISLLWIYLSYHVLKILKRNVETKLYFETYKSNCKIALEKYGDLPIKRVYLVRKRLNPILAFLLDVVTWKSYGKQLSQYRVIANDMDFFPFHTYMMVEVELENKMRKYVIIEKSNGVEVTTNLSKYASQEMMKVSRKNGVKTTINEVLEQTKERMGPKHFFNWHLYKNNCQQFMVEILKSLDKNNPTYEEFILQKDFFKTIKISDLAMYIMNYLINAWSFIESVYTDTVNIDGALDGLKTLLGRVKSSTNEPSL